jgi:hypothetical protein
MNIFMKYFCLSFCSLTFAAAQTHLFVNPGIKAGYVFGKDGGFTFGYELSFVMVSFHDRVPAYGLVIDYDWPRNGKRLHVGLECIYWAAGVDVGPSFIWENGNRTTGLSVIPFVCAEILIPYYHYTYVPDSTSNYNEAGMYLKLPMTGYLR